MRRTNRAVAGGRHGRVTDRITLFWECVAVVRSWRCGDGNEVTPTNRSVHQTIVSMHAAMQHDMIAAGDDVTGRARCRTPGIGRRHAWCMTPALATSVPAQAEIDAIRTLVDTERWPVRRR